MNNDYIQLLYIKINLIIKTWGVWDDLSYLYDNNTKCLIYIESKEEIKARYDQICDNLKKIDSEVEIS